MCPGKQQADGLSGHWQRDLGMDLERIRAWDASLLVSLVEHREFAAWASRRCRAKPAAPRHGMAYLPIPDRRPPGLDFEQRWLQVGAELVAALRGGRRVFLRCMGGLGRTGTVAACLLREAGLDAEEAVAQVRLSAPESHPRRRSRSGAHRMPGGLAGILE